MKARKIRFLRASLSVLALMCVLPVWGAGPEGLELSLKEALHKARERNPALQRQLLEQVRREAEVQEARGALLPTLQAQAGEIRHSINFEALAGMSVPGFPSVVGPFSVRSFGAQAQIPLLDLSLWRRWRGSKSMLDGSVAETDRMHEEISALVVGQYLLALRAEAQVDAVQARIGLAKSLEDLAVHQEQSGLGTGLDTLRAKVRSRVEEQALIRARTSHQEALSGLLRLLDLPADTSLRIKAVAPSESAPASLAAASFSEDLLAAHSTRADFRILDSQSRAADERLESVRALHLPSIQAFASVEKLGLVTSNMERVFEVGVQVTVPLFTGWRTQAQVSQARAARSQVDATRRELEARVGFELRMAKERLEAAHSEVAVAEETLRLATAELEQARHRFEAGVSSNIELVSAQEELAKAEEGHLDARYRLDQAQADLAFARGELETRYAH